MWTGHMPRMFGANQGSGERNDQEAVAAREGSSLYPRNWPNDASIDQHSVAQPVQLRQHQEKLGTQ